MTAYAAAHSTYRESSVLTASPEQLVVMLYDGANRFLLQAAAAMRTDAREASHDRLRRAEAIIEELHTTLDLSQGEVAERLAAIYIFCRRLLNEARLERNADKVDQVAGLLAELREAWAEINNLIAGYERLADLAEAETAAAIAGDFERLDELVVAREELRATLPPVAPAEARPALERAHAAHDAAVHALHVGLAEVRQGLERLERGRTQVRGYGHAAAKLVDATS